MIGGLILAIAIWLGQSISHDYNTHYADWQSYMQEGE